MSWHALSKEGVIQHPMYRLGGWLLWVVIMLGVASFAALILEILSFAHHNAPQIYPALVAGYEERIVGITTAIIALMLCCRAPWVPIMVSVCIWGAFFIILFLQGLTLYARFVTADQIDSIRFAFSLFGWLSRHGFIAALLIGFTVALQIAERPNIRYRQRFWRAMHPDDEAFL